MKRTFFTLLLALFASFPLLNAQMLNHKLGEALIRLENEADLQQIIQRLQTFQNQPTRLRVLEETVPYMRIYRLSFDHTVIPERDFLGYLNRFPGIQVAQFNHIVKNRSTIPDDPEFANQWQYINEGLDNCTAGGDIDADLAWDITTGGKNAFGDDIVVCIVDDGLDPDHSDFEGNVWVNEAEIPDNGIDDDNNGFVDDYAGWNTSSDTDDTDASNWHGTPVAGIVGAKGNNGIGVAGVNWDVKLMIVVGGTGVESEVLKAYSFPLAHRMRYNATNGEEGSFVVATNSSWGVDFGQPADAPLWCAFYDTLGVHGILNAGATINGNQNVDEIGDLPTACPSDFMISVTNLDCTDSKITSAGYGAETIDLGAFGQGTWTAANNDGYGGFGGTSGATPHVAGAIALLYSAPCSNLSQMAISDPAEAALLVRQAILDGTRPNASLDTITVTGGVLNLYNSLQLLLTQCGPCPQAFGLKATELTDSSAVLNWVSSDSTLSSSLYWREAGAEEWNIVPDTVAPIAISGLSVCTPYEFAIEDSCADTVSFSFPQSFSTTGCCDPPEKIAAEASSTEVALSWDTVPAAQAYQLLLNCSKDSLVIDSIAGTMIVLNQLDSCQACIAQVRSICGDTLSTEISEPLPFEIPGCGPCIDPEFCEVEGDSDYEYIEQIILGPLDNFSGNDGGYGDYTGMSTELETNEQYELKIVPVWPLGEYAESYFIWIDFDRDGNFENDSELIYEINDVTDTLNDFVTIPAGVTPGETRMRIAMIYEPDFPQSCGDIGFGETEDYCVTITDELPDCLRPELMSLDSAGYESLHLSWESLPNDSLYQLQYRSAGAGDWSDTIEVNTPFADIDGLGQCTTYDVRLRSLCGFGGSPWLNSLLVTRCNPACDDWFDGFAVDTATTSSALLSWNASPQVQYYQIEYRPDSITSWLMLETEDTQLILDSLVACTDHFVRLWGVCEGINNRVGPVALEAFETACVNQSDSRLPDSWRMLLQPNPFREQLQLSLNAPGTEQVQVRVFQSNGQLIHQRAFQTVPGAQQLEISTVSWPSGLYWVQLTSAAGTTSRKVIKK